jgi:hypothetical protein
VFEALVEIAVVHYIEHACSANTSEYKNIKRTFQGWEEKYRDDLIQYMKHDQRPGNPNLNGFINQLFLEEPRVSQAKFVEKLQDRMVLNWIMHPEHIINRMILFDQIYDPQDKSSVPNDKSASYVHNYNNGFAE